MSYLAHTRDLKDLNEVILRDPVRYTPIVAFVDAVLRTSSELSWAERELIATALCADNGSTFCQGVRYGVAEALDTKKDVLRSISVDPGHPPVAEKLRSLFIFARKLNDRSRSITEEDVQKVRAAGWNDQTIEDVVGLVAAIAVFNTLANGLGFKADPNDPLFTEMGKATVTAGGYEALFNTYLQQAGVEHAEKV